MDELPYVEREVQPIIVNVVPSTEAFTALPVSSDQLCLVKDDYFETTNHKVSAVTATSTETDYPTINAARAGLCTTDPLYIEMLENGYVGFKQEGSVGSGKSISYSTDRVNWVDTTLAAVTGTGNLIAVSSGQRIYFKSSDNIELHASTFNYIRMVVVQTNAVDGTIASYNVGGALASLFNYMPPDGLSGVTSNFFRESGVVSAEDLDVSVGGTGYPCRAMFYGCASLIAAPTLSASTLRPYAYLDMFRNCTALTKAPALPAPIMTNYCYERMFKGCTALVDMPVIGATVTANYCCEEMFADCTALATAQPLWAPTMSLQCYKNMFKNCTALVQLPQLPATVLAENCYYGMFDGCSNIKLSTTQTTPYLTLYKVPNTPVFYYDTLWDTTIVTAPDSEATMANTLFTYSPEAITLSTARYMRDTTNGSSANASNHWNEIKIWYNGENIGKSKPIYGSNGTTYTNSVANDDVINNSYIDLGTGKKSVVVDLGASYAIGAVFIWHYYADGRTYYDNVTEISDDGINWGTIYSGQKKETSSGNQIEFTLPGTFTNSTKMNVRGCTLIGLTFASNSTNYDSMYCDSVGNFYYGSNGTNTKVYDISTGWVNSAYQNLIVPSDKSQFENLFANNSSNLYDPTTVTTGYYINASGVLTSENTCQVSAYISVVPGHSYTWTGVSGKTGTNNKRAVGYATNDQVTGTAINSVAVTGTGVDYNNTFTVPTGINYVRLSFNIADTDVVLIDNDATGTGDWLTFKQQNLTIVYGWDTKGQSLTMPFTSNSTDYSVLSVDATGNILYDTTSAYNASSGWANNNYKTIRTTFHTSQKFTGADTWLPFYTTNKISVTGPTTIAVPTNALTDMFANTGGSFTGTPTINTAYWLSIPTIERVFEWDYTDGNNGLLSVSSSVADAAYEYRSNGLYLYSGTTSWQGINVGFPSALYSRLKTTITSISVEISYINHDTANGQFDAVIVPTTRTTNICSAKIYFLAGGGIRGSGKGNLWNFGSSHPSAGTVKATVDFSTDMFTAFLDGTQVGTISEITTNLGNNGSALLSVTNGGTAGTATITHIRVTWQEASL